MALPTLLVAPSMRDISAVNFIETAKPALSSAGEVIFEPEDKRASDWLNMVDECSNSEALLCADRLVLMTITLSVSSPRRAFVARHPCRVRAGSRAARHFPAGVWWRPAADPAFAGRPIHRKKKLAL